MKLCLKINLSKGELPTVANGERFWRTVGDACPYENYIDLILRDIPTRR